MPFVTLLLLVCSAQTTQSSLLAAAPTSLTPGPATAAPVAAAPTTQPGAMVQTSAAELADKVFQASGGDMWPKAKRIRFTCKIEGADQPAVEAVHDWDVRNGTDSVMWNGKSVSVDLRTPPADDEAKAAFERWSIDTYWLVTPLKIKDPGVTLSLGTPTEIGGTTYNVLRVGVEDAAPPRAGDAPAGPYDLYIDPHTHLVRHCDRFPGTDRKISGSWDAYTDFAGLQLSTGHVVNGTKITFSDIRVELD